MSIVGSIVDVMSSGGLGAIVGAIGGFVAKREERKNLELNIQREIELAKIRTNELQLEQNHELMMADKQVARAQTEAEIAQELKAGDAFIESIRMAGKDTGILIVDAVRGLMRPLITSYLLIVTTVLFFEVQRVIGGLDNLPTDTVTEIYMVLIKQIVFLTVTAVSWWFATRPGNSVRVHV